MATLAASLLKPAELHTFGEPRVGNSLFASFMQRLGQTGMM